MIKAVIFDIDGVLIDSFERNLEVFRAVLKQAGYKKIPTKNDYKKLFAHTAINIFKSLAGTTNKNELSRLMHLLPDANQGTKTPLKLTPDSVAVIKRLHKKFLLALVTSRTQPGVEHYLSVANTKNYFTAIIHYGHYKNAKPHPEPLLLACKKLKVTPQEAVYVGDAAFDIQAAHAANMKVILYNKKRIRGAHAYTQNFLELPAIIKTLNSTR